MKEKLISLTLTIILITFSITVGFLATSEIESLVIGLRSDYGDSPEECVNLSLKATSYCLKNYVGEIYKYNVTQDIKKLTLEELKENGGDCKNWAELYYDYGKELGFYVRRPLIDIDKRSAHTFTVISDETGYCILDQLSIKCVELEPLDSEE